MPMGIAHYIREIGRGKQGAKDLTREQACDLMMQVLAQTIEPVSLGAFCVAMRIKGETADEMLGFLDAAEAQLHFFNNTHAQPVVVLPSYNGARRLPLFTPLLARLLANQGHAVLMHGCSGGDNRITSEALLGLMGIAPATHTHAIQPGQVVWAPTALLSSGLWALLQVRRETGLRNPGHSLVKLMNPVSGPSLQVVSYTHPEYAVSMQATLSQRKANALILRGTEGEPVADPRKIPQIRTLMAGHLQTNLQVDADTYHSITDLPTGMNAEQTLLYCDEILSGRRAVPPALMVQADLISRLSLACMHSTHPSNSP
jgi:anthranilate phosphoribosyltransferase